MTQFLSCSICHNSFHKKDLFPLEICHDNFLNTVKNYYHSIDLSGFLCHNDFEICSSLHRRWIVKNLASSPSPSSEHVLNSMEKSKLVSNNVNDLFVENLTFLDKLSDRVADFGGSWTFITSFAVVIFIWILANTYAFLNPFDPYPYIFLNLILSCIAALQAPVIMMSQKRQEKRDRFRSEQDYHVNLKAELEIRQIKNMIKQLSTLTWHTRKKKKD